MPRFHCPVPLTPGEEIALPPGAARHVQVLRMQPGEAITLFHGGLDGPGGEFEATVTRMGRQDVDLRIGAHVATARELACPVTIALGMPANERMDALVEKATELGVAAIQPLMCARSVLKLSGDRAEKRRAHWQAVAVAAAEQSGRTVVPTVAPILALERWLGEATGTPGLRHVLSFDPDAAGPATLLQARGPVLLLSGDYYVSRLPDPVLQQVEHWGDPTISVNDAFKPVTRYWDRITRPEQLIQSLPQALGVLLDPADCGPAFIGLCQDVQAEAFDWPEAFFEPRLHNTRRRPGADPDELERAVALLRAAEAAAVPLGPSVMPPSTASA